MPTIRSIVLGLLLATAGCLGADEVSNEATTDWSGATEFQRWFLPDHILVLDLELGTGSPVIHGHPVAAELDLERGTAILGETPRLDGLYALLRLRDGNGSAYYGASDLVGFSLTIPHTSGDGSDEPPSYVILMPGSDTKGPKATILDVWIRETCEATYDGPTPRPSPSQGAAFLDPLAPGDVVQIGIVSGVGCAPLDLTVAHEGFWKRTSGGACREPCESGS